MIHRKSTFIFSLLVLSAIACSAQRGQDLQGAYARKSEALLDSILLKSKPKLSKLSKVTDSVLDNVLHAILVGYADRKNQTNDSSVVPGIEKYIIVQPQIEVGVVKQLDSAALFNRRIDLVRGKESKFSEKKVYRPFLSPRLVVFKDMKDLGIYDVNPNMKMVYGYQPLVIDTSAINDINAMLEVKKGIERGKISAFLEKDIKLHNSMFLEIFPGYGKVRTKFFNVSVFIERIVLNEANDAAFVEFSFPNSALKSYYRKLAGRWCKMTMAWTLEN